MDRLADILSRAFLSMILKKLAYKFFSLMISIPSLSAVLLYPPMSIIKAAAQLLYCLSQFQAWAGLSRMVLLLLLPRVSREVAFEWWLGLIHTGWQGLCAWCPGRDAESALSLSLFAGNWMGVGSWDYKSRRCQVLLRLTFRTGTVLLLLNSTDGSCSQSQIRCTWSELHAGVNTGSVAHWRPSAETDCTVLRILWPVTWAGV